MISDGYGDEDLVEDVLPRYEKWAHAVANDLLGSPHHPDHEDLVQEARIAIWRSLRTHDRAKGALPSYVTQAARWQMHDAVERKKWTGQDTKQGKARTDRIRPTDSLDAMFDAGLTDMLMAADVLDEVCLAYHHGQISSAIAALPQHHRQFVYLRFWAGMTDAEIKAHTGRSLGSLWRVSGGIRDQLRSALLHLESV